MIYWIFGRSGTGKTTIGKLLAKKIKAIFLDSEDLRNIFTNLGYSKVDRWENNFKAYSLAELINNQGFDVVIAIMTPFETFREVYLYDKLKIKTIYLKCPKTICQARKPETYKKFPLDIFEEPKKFDIMIDTSKYKPEEAINIILKKLQK
ncbi:MAG TPA: adenylyl-sulfate kinase [Candidatus Desulfofervidus auxilii]|uniref:Adenylyl-sulfate kinase n=1 Tax=Desulfofervidus auxilii TaxID=1621989 RepID=A0A7C0U483_DESA2|nr:adenylyl-sulfate kinase [Candidatus Desulfofervidus auxilii]